VLEPEADDKNAGSRDAVYVEVTTLGSGGACLTDSTW